MTERYWTVAQTVSKMEHIARRDIEKGGHGAFLPTYARHWKVDGRPHAKECPLFTGYVFFMTEAEDWAGIPDIHGVYRVPANPNGKAQRVKDCEMARLVLGHASGDHNRTDAPRYTRYYNPDRVPKPKRKGGRRSRPRRSKAARGQPRHHPDMQITDDAALHAQR
ncbi:antitermination protein NusG [Bradyrhizobium ottawaense]|uniref:transcription termination/antitermination protein NusG n=1 Tax=Bradyrhizobium ottawaense TaxID=931866 RepID=UPI000BEA0F5C|nr:transcription termination/antitermination NusG family protein [Bradyrhizobium ottawaense]PDT71722.1 antitermination protein NusG [Bradyrhizobium ottawaense]